MSINFNRSYVLLSSTTYDTGFVKAFLNIVGILLLGKYANYADFDKKSFENILL